MVLCGAYLMKVDVIIERCNVRQLGGPKPRYGISADGKEYKCHVELECFSSTFGREETVTHDMISIFSLVLDELPRKQPNHH